MHEWAQFRNGDLGLITLVRCLLPVLERARHGERQFVRLETFRLRYTL